MQGLALQNVGMFCKGLKTSPEHLGGDIYGYGVNTALSFRLPTISMDCECT